MWTVGQGAWDYYDLFSSFPPSPSLADAGYLAFAPPLVAGLLAIGRGTRRSRLLLSLDISVMLVGFAVLFAAVFWPHLRDSRLNLSAQVTSMLYPVVYATLAATVLIVPLRRTWRDGSLRFLLLGLVGQTIPFILWTPLLLDGTFAEGTALDAIWMVSMLFIAASALCFDEFPLVDVERQVHGATAFVPLALTIAAVLARLWLHLTL